MINFLKKIQDQPKRIRKIIFWVIVIIIGIFFLFTFIYSLKARIEAIKPREIFKQYRPPSFEEDLKKIPKIEAPELPETELSEEELKELEKAIEEELKAREEAKEESSIPEAPQ